MTDEFANSPAGLAARQQLALIQLHEGNRRLVLDRDEGVRMLEDAAKNFETVIRESGDAMVKQHATYQLGRAYESLGQLENARTEYEKLGKTWPDSAYATAAKGRLEDLDKPETKEFYDWYKTARMQSLAERMGVKPGDATKDEPGRPDPLALPDLLADPLALPDPPQRKDLPGPEVKQPENKAATDKQPETKAGSEKQPEGKAGAEKGKREKD